MTVRIDEYRPYELEMIRKDVGFYYDLALAIAGKPDTGTIMFGLTPYLGLFVKETYDYSRKNLPDFYTGIKQTHENFLFSMRLSAKLFDEDLRNFDEILEEIEWVLNQHNSDFNKNHKGLFTWVQKFQRDLGLFFIDNHLYSTSHTSSFNMGLVRENLQEIGQTSLPELGPVLKEVSSGMGQYISLLKTYLLKNSGKIENIPFQYPFAQTSFTYKDVFSKKYYAKTFKNTDRFQFKFYFLTFLAAVNFLRFILKNIIIDTPETFFKIKYITLYHLITSSKNLQSNHYKILTENEKKLFQEITSHPASKKIITPARFRNALVHYDIQKIPVDKLNEKLRTCFITRYSPIKRG